jgi:hypothetical protein
LRADGNRFAQDPAGFSITRAEARLPSRPPQGGGDGFDADRHQITVRTDDVATVLAELTGWAQPLGLPLDRLEVGPPSLEDAYLALTSGKEAQS